MMGGDFLLARWFVGGGRTGDQKNQQGSPQKRGKREAGKSHQALLFQKFVFSSILKIKKTKNKGLLGLELAQEC
jgi:hypothetical protein